MWHVSVWVFVDQKFDFDCSYFQLQRNILASNPRVTRFHINWDGPKDQMDNIENVDPEPDGFLSPSCAYIKGLTPSMSLQPENSMDCMWFKYNNLRTLHRRWPATSFYRKFEREHLGTCVQ